MRQGGAVGLEFHLRDHASISLSKGLDNTRLVMEETDEKNQILQEAAYYPFGMAISDLSFALPNENSTTQNRYLYNGKELQDDFGLDWGACPALCGNYGARFYDA